MPTIKQYTPDQVSPTVVRGPRANFSGLDYGPIAKGVKDLGAGIVDTMNRIDTTSAEEALVKFERDKNDIFFNPEKGYFNTQGRNAYDAAGMTSEAITELKRTYGNDLNTNARNMFNRVADQHITRAQTDIQKHSSKGLKAWEVATIDAQVENTIENATLYWNQPDKLKVQQALGEAAILDSATMTGVGPEATNEKLQTYRSQFAKGSIEAATAQGSAQGETALDKYGSNLEPQMRVKVDKMIDSKKKAEETQYIASSAVLTSTRLVEDYDSRSEIIKEVNKIKDPKLRKATMSQSMYNYSQKKQAESEERAATFEDAEKFVRETGGAEVWKSQNPEAWDNLNADQQRELESGKAIETDQVWLTNTLLLPKEELAKIDPTEHFTKLSPGADRNKLTSAVKTAKGKASKSEKTDAQVGRTRTTQTNLAVEQLFGKKTKWKKKDIPKVNSFYSLIDSEVSFREDQKGAKLSSEEYTDLLNNLTREVVVEGFVFDSEYDITDIPTEDIEPLTDFLRQNSIPVTADNLHRVYKQASE